MGRTVGVVGAVTTVPCLERAKNGSERFTTILHQDRPMRTRDLPRSRTAFQMLEYLCVCLIVLRSLHHQWHRKLPWKENRQAIGLYRHLFSSPRVPLEIPDWLEITHENSEVSGMSGFVVWTILQIEFCTGSRSGSACLEVQSTIVKDSLAGLRAQIAAGVGEA